MTDYSSQTLDEITPADAQFLGFNKSSRLRDIIIKNLSSKISELNKLSDDEIINQFHQANFKSLYPTAIRELNMLPPNKLDEFLTVSISPITKKFEDLILSDGLKESNRKSIDEAAMKSWKI